MDNILAAIKRTKYEEGVTLITPTGDRQTCIQRAEFYIQRQTYQGPLQWLVADNGKTKTKVTLGQEYIKNPNKDCSLNINIRSMLLRIRYNHVLIIEDDDWYSPEYIKTYLARLRNYQLVGECARYYNVAKCMYRIWENSKHSSFCQTGLRSEILDKLYVCSLNPSPFIDKRLWVKDAKKFVFQDKVNCVGIKGMPGRTGIGMGHRPDAKRFKTDKDWKELENWIGKEDTEFYKQWKTK